MTQRIAIVVFGVFLFGAASAMVLPTSPNGENCGTWVMPEWADDQSEQLVRDGLKLGGEGNAIAARVVAAKRACDDALSTRRTATIVLFGLALAAPAAVVFIGANRRDT